ncbi:hypothetical protein K7X08_009956 [Anisodus acutangulus]|uniref:Uncharacterized protein n=1 Tax=Anisodus acutangulus TaxID=402998 RepID=A0A9Q1N496_9SOLA|nr:hypothetical protein K7X08_009956 [Anisodus acutangulus]
MLGGESLIESFLLLNQNISSLESDQLAKLTGGSHRDDILQSCGMTMEFADVLRWQNFGWRIEMQKDNLCWKAGSAQLIILPSLLCNFGYLVFLFKVCIFHIVFELKLWRNFSLS